MNWLNGSDTSVPVTIISVALMLASGFLMTRITKKLRLPNVTAYIVGGILAGPFVLNLIPQSVVEGTAFRRNRHRCLRHCCSFRVLFLKKPD